MKEILEIVIKNLVDNRDDVIINETSKDDAIVFVIKIVIFKEEFNMGKVIGKQGRMAKSIRTLMKAIATKEDKKVTIEFVD